MIDIAIGFLILFGCFSSYMLGRQHEKRKHTYRIMNDATQIARSRANK